jgi:hypothetical protein
VSMLTPEAARSGRAHLAAARPDVGSVTQLDGLE